jgi:hypothetical protein
MAFIYIYRRTSIGSECHSGHGIRDEIDRLKMFLVGVGRSKLDRRG